MAGRGYSQSKPCRTARRCLNGGTPAPRQAARLRGPLRPAPLAAVSEKLLEGQRPAARAATPISPARLAFAWRPRSAARQNAASAYRPLCWRWVPQPNAKVAGLRGVLSSVACAGSLERPPSRNLSTLVRWQGALSAVGLRPASNFAEAAASGAGRRGPRKRAAWRGAAVPAIQASTGVRQGLLCEHPPLKLTHSRQSAAGSRTSLVKLRPGSP